MSWKKKQTRKYKPRNEFRRNGSPLAENHPHYIFGEINGKYKSLGLTRNPVDGIRHIKLIKNPNSNSSDESYLQMRVHTAKKKYYGPLLKNWEFSQDDMPVVRNTIKKYKKSINRKPKLWYEKKRKRNKK